MQRPTTLGAIGVSLLFLSAAAFAASPFTTFQQRFDAALDEDTRAELAQEALRQADTPRELFRVQDLWRAAQPRRASAAIRAANHENPQSLRFAVLRARLIDQPEDRLVLAGQILDRDPQAPLARHLYGEAWQLVLHDVDPVDGPRAEVRAMLASHLPRLQRASGEPPSDPGFARARAEAFLARERPEQARDAFERAAELQDTRSGDMLHARILVAMGEDSGARDILERQHRATPLMDPRFRCEAPVKTVHARMMIMAGRTEEALERLVELPDSCPLVLYNRAVAVLKLGHESKAVDLLLQAAERGCADVQRLTRDFNRQSVTSDVRLGIVFSRFHRNARVLEQQQAYIGGVNVY